MNEVVHESTWKFSIPRGKAVEGEAFQDLTQQFAELHRHLIELNGSFARLIKAESGKDEYRFAFFRLDQEIPETIVVFHSRGCFMVHCEHVHRGSFETDIADGVHRLVNLICVTSQHSILGRSQEIDNFMIALQTRSPRTSSAPSTSSLS